MIIIIVVLIVVDDNSDHLVTIAIALTSTRYIIEKEKNKNPFFKLIPLSLPINYRMEIFDKESGKFWWVGKVGRTYKYLFLCAALLFIFIIVILNGIYS